MNKVKKKGKSRILEFLKRLVSHQLFIPLLAVVILVIINLVHDPGFFKITPGYNNAGNLIFSGSLITILDFGSELGILAIGMTLVTAASGGQDISVGATIAIAGSAMLRIICGGVAHPEQNAAPVWVAFIVACLVGMACGLFNGLLVAVFKIQPMIATLILFTAGRSIAAWINHNELPIVPDPKFSYFGGVIPGIPIPTTVFIMFGCMIIIALVLKFTNLGLYTQAVGINEKSARLNGINPLAIKILAFVILGLCVAVAALIKVSRLSTINYSVIAKDIEMDAILAVALGGNALSGGKFNMWASILGAYIIQFLTTTLYKFNFPSEELSVYKAIVVIVLVIISAPTVREGFNRFVKKLTPARKEAA